MFLKFFGEPSMSIYSLLKAHWKVYIKQRSEILNKPAYRQVRIRASKYCWVN